MPQEVFMRKRLALPAAVLGLAGALAAVPAPASQTGGYGLSVVINGSAVPEYGARGRVYVEALKGQSFTLRLSNPTGERVAVALSVDGRNVVDARHTSAQKATKWILDPWQTLEIPGWQISGETSRRFFFTETSRSYAKWLGDTSNVGTIEAIFFRERRRRVAQPLAGVEKDEAPSANRERAQGDGGMGPGESQASPAPSAEPQSTSKAQAGAATDSYAATGIGERSSFPVTWVDFQEDPTPAASIALRYEFRPELVRLGVLSSDGDLWAREKAQGFERKYAPSPSR
jgi:hypothetical protein